MAQLPITRQRWTPPAARVEGDRLLKARAAQQRMIDAAIQAKAEAKAVEVQAEKQLAEKVDELDKDLDRLIDNIPKIMPSGGGGRRMVKKILANEYDLPNGLGSAAGNDTEDFATAVQGGKADTAVQPDDLASVATSGSQDDMSDGTTNKNYTATEQSKLADAVVKSDTSVSGFSFAVDEDDMASNSATLLPTQQSVKANIDLYAVRNVADRTALAASPATIIFNRDAADEKIWIKTSDDISAEITAADPRYLPTSGDATGASGGFYQAGSLPTGGFFASDANPARIIRINDRLLLGEAAINDGLSANVLTSWVGKTDDPSIDGPGQPNMAWIESQAVLAVSTPSGKGRIAVSGYGQTKGANAGSFAIGLNGFVYNNNDVNACNAEALYLDAKRANENVEGSTWGAEIAITNLGDFRRVGPWTNEGGATMGVHIQAGGGTFTNGHSTDVSLGLRFANNGAAFDRLIVASGLSGRDYTDANSEPYRIMISSPGGYAWEWVNSDDDLTASIKGVGLDAAQAVGLEIGKQQILLKNLVTGKTQFTAGGVTNGVNYVSILSGATGAGAQIKAVSNDDANVDLYLLGKGSGWVRTTSHLNMTGFDLYRSGVKVVGARKTGWGSPAGTLSRAAYTSYAGTTHGAAYSQTDIQTVDNKLKELSQTMAALLTDMHASTSGHGLIGLT